MLPPWHDVFYVSVMATPKLDATLRLEISRWLPPAADTDIRHQDDRPCPKCRENGPSLTSPETSREYEGARCCPHSGCHAFPASDLPPSSSCPAFHAVLRSRID